MSIDLATLRAPFPADEIEWRVGSTTGDKKRGLALAYLTSRHVMNRLDEVCGIDGWQDRYEFHGPRTVCYLSIKIGDEWVTKADAAGDTQVEAEKGSVSDALKRAAVKWGIGRYLYSLGNTWVELEPAGRSFKIKDSEYPRLQRMLREKFGGEVSGAGRTEQPPEPSEPGAPTLSDHLDAIETAETMVGLQEIFAAAWKACTASSARTKIKAAYDKRKAVFSDAKSHLDRQFHEDAAA